MDRLPQQRCTPAELRAAIDSLDVDLTTLISTAAGCGCCIDPVPWARTGSKHPYFDVQTFWLHNGSALLAALSD